MGGEIPERRLGHAFRSVTAECKEAVPLVRWLVLNGEDCDTDAAALLAWFWFWFNPGGTGGNGSLSQTAEPAARASPQVEADRRL